MAEQLKQMSGDEFVQKLLAGERDFRRIKLQEWYDVSAHEKFTELQERLEKSLGDLKENPLNLLGANFSRVTAPHLFFPYTIAQKAVFEESNFYHCNFRFADFTGASFCYASFPEVNFNDAVLKNTSLAHANFWHAHLSNTDLSNADLSRAQLELVELGNADVSYANFNQTNLSEANLYGVRNLSLAHCLSTAHFLKTKISREDVKVVKLALKDRKSIIYPGFWD